MLPADDDEDQDDEDGHEEGDGNEADETMAAEVEPDLAAEERPVQTKVELGVRPQKSKGKGKGPKGKGKIHDRLLPR